MHPCDIINLRDARLVLSERELCILLSLERHHGEGKDIYWLADEWDDLVGLVRREMNEAARGRVLASCWYP